MAHELIHVRRGDVVFAWLQLAAKLVWWFHPLVWWANRQGCREVERCCDEEVVAGPACRPASYARCLLDVLESPQGPRPVYAFPGIHPAGITRRRLEHLMNRNGRFRRRMPRIYWAVLVAGLMLVVPGAGLVVQAPSAAVEGAGTESGGAGAAGEQPAPFPVVEKLEPWEADWRRIAPKLLRDKSVAETPWSEFVFRHVGLKMREDWHSDGRVASSRVRDGELDLRYEVRNRQVNVYLPGASRVGATALHDLRLIPRLTRPEECDAETRRDGLVLLRRGGSEILADPSTGFAHRMTSRYPNGEVRWERWQWQPIEYPGNIIFPKLSAEASYHDGNLSSLELVLIESASFNQSFPADAFTLSVPADTNVVDYRKDDFRPRVFRLKEPVDDLSAYLR